jgi:hypothetical protein
MENKMKALLPVILLGAVLGGCVTDQKQIPVEYRTKYEAVIPPDSLYQCPKHPTPPSSKKLTDRKVAEYLVKLDNGYKICSKSISAIRAFATEAKLTVESQSQ